jgi:ribosome-binding protein aMBF1 (putative translation factor)
VTGRERWSARQDGGAGRGVSARGPGRGRLGPKPLPADATHLIGRLLGDAREDAGLPQSAAAAALGAPQSRVAKVELGRRQLLFHEAVILCDLYGIELEQLDPRLHQPRARAGRRQRMDLPRESPSVVSRPE